MLQEHYTKILDHFTEWKVGVDNYHKSKIGGRPRLDNTENEASEPLKGHPVVLSFKAIARACDWCEGTCSKEKIYKRSIGSNIWQGKCEDCGEKRNILTSEINITK